MDILSYREAMGQIHAEEHFLQQTAARMRQAERGGAPPKQHKKKGWRRYFIPSAAAALLVLGVCLYGIWGPLHWFRPDEITDSRMEEAIGRMPTIEWEGRCYQLQDPALCTDDPEVAVDPKAQPVGMGSYQGQEIALVPVEGKPPLLYLAADLGQGYELFSFLSFVEERPFGDILYLYEQASGPMDRITLETKDNTQPDRPGDVRRISSGGEISPLKEELAQLTPDGSLRVQERNTSWSDDSSTLTHKVDTKALLLNIHFADGESFSLNLYAEDGIAGGFGHMYALTDGLMEWISG